MNVKKSSLTAFCLADVCALRACLDTQRGEIEYNVPTPLFGFVDEVSMQMERENHDAVHSLDHHICCFLQLVMSHSQRMSAEILCGKQPTVSRGKSISSWELQVESNTLQMSMNA